MKKFICIMLVVVLALSSLVLVVACKEKGEAKVYYVEEEGKTPYLIKKYENGDFCDDPLKIIASTDLHLDGTTDVYSGAYAATMLELGLMGKYIDIEKPDLVVFTGDILLGREWRGCADKLMKLMEDKQQYWFLVLGNHDGQDIEYGRRDIIAYIQKSPYCLSRAGDTFGFGNFIVNVKNGDGKIIQSLIGIDSNDYMTREYCEEDGIEFVDGSYGYVRPAQITWYKAKIDALTEENGGETPKSMIFMHIPVPEMKTPDEKIDGVKREPICSPDRNSGFFAAIKEKNSTQAMFFGHDHTNDYVVKYQGVILAYNASLSFNSYHARENALWVLAEKKGQRAFNDGYTKTMVNQDSTVEITHCYNRDMPGIFSGFEEYTKKIGIDETITN